ERIVFEEKIDQITLPTKMGEITLLPNHLPLVSTLIPGEILFKIDKEEIPMVVSGGFVEFNNNTLTILADTAEKVEEIDEKRAEEGRQKAKELLDKKQDMAEVDFVALSSQMEKELARLRVIRKYKKLKPRLEIKREEDNN
ncbi:ATP synthase F1 subunit epsilon, partial [bacterium]|nr:ATP synthase F1 subunit epsilon [bacterium]